MSLPQALLSDRIALVTGASRGIGRAVALRLAHAGATVILAARTEAPLHDVAEEIRAFGREALAVPTDVTEDRQLETLVTTTQQRFGRIDLLVNNAGGGSPRTVIHKSRREEWEQTLRANLWATMTLTKLVLPGMIERRAGAVINIGSVAGLTGKAGEAAYAAAKFGVRGFTQALFEEVRNFGIKVALICSGYVDTTMIPPNRRVEREKMLAPHDVAEAVFYVATTSPRSCPLEILLQPQHDPFRP